MLSTGSRVFAIVLPLRLRRAQTGTRSAIGAVGIIAAVLLLANLIEVLIPGFIPVWMQMQVQMVLVVLLMAGVVAEVIRWAVNHKD